MTTIILRKEISETMYNLDLIKNGIESCLRLGHKNFVIYPFGEIGMQTQELLNKCYGIKESFIIDKNLSKYNNEIKSLEYLKEVDCSKYIFLVASINNDIREELIKTLEEYVPSHNIKDLVSIDNYERTYCGKYSYGPLCNHWLVKRVGAFCSFAQGTDVVQNHPIQYISTHPFLYYSSHASDIYNSYNEYSRSPWFFPDIEPMGEQYKFRKITVGNDVWLGANVIITNSANIGNGVIAAAGAVITKDVPDYAVVAGVPAKIIRYRYTADQIEKLNQIRWWDWSDDNIKLYYSDFYEGIESFIKKHYKK